MIYEKIESVAKEVGLSPSTIKKYYLLIEKHGYRFARNNQGRVLFNESEVKLFKEMILLKKEPGISVEEAAKKVVTSITALTIYQAPTIEEEPDFQTQLDKMKEHMEMQDEKIQALVEEQVKTKNYIEDSLKERDRKLMLAMRQSQEEKKQRKKKWYQFWK